MKVVGICIPTIEGGTLCHQEIGREAWRRDYDYPSITTHTPAFEEIRLAAETDDFDQIAALLVDSINRTANAGAEFAIIPSNTMHVVIDDIIKGAKIPVLNLLDVVSDYCISRGFKKVGILGTPSTIRRRIYDVPFHDRGITAVYPSPQDQEAMMSVILNELVCGIFLKESRTLLEDIVRRLGADCDAVMLGCTELPIVITEDGCGVKLIDSTRILAHAALDEAIS